MHFAEQKLFIAIAIMLWAFDIRPSVDKEGNAMLPAQDEWVDATAVMSVFNYYDLYRAGLRTKYLSRRPAPFECNFSPRFPGVQEILENVITTTT